MRQHVVLVANRDAVMLSVVISLQWSGYEVMAWSNPYLVLDDLDAGQPVDVLISQVEMGAGLPNGVSIGLMARQRRPHVGLVFIGPEEFRPFTAGLGELVTPPFSFRELRDSVARVADAVMLSRRMKIDASLREWATGRQVPKVTRTRAPTIEWRGTPRHGLLEVPSRTAQPVRPQPRPLGEEAGGPELGV